MKKILIPSEYYLNLHGATIECLNCGNETLIIEMDKIIECNSCGELFEIKSYNSSLDKN